MEACVRANERGDYGGHDDADAVCGMLYAVCCMISGKCWLELGRYGDVHMLAASIMESMALMHAGWGTSI